MRFHIKPIESCKAGLPHGKPQGSFGSLGGLSLHGGFRVEREIPEFLGNVPAHNQAGRCAKAPECPETELGHLGVSIRSSNSARKRPSARTKPRCRIPDRIFHRRYLTLSSTSYTTNPRHSRSVASFPSHGFHAPERTFSPTSNSRPPPISRRGKRFSPIPRIRLHIIPVLFLSAVQRQLRP